MSRFLVCLLVVASLLQAPTRADAFCKCRVPRPPRCDDPEAKFRMNLDINLTVQDGAVEVVTQSGPFHLPVSELTGAPIIGIVLDRGEVFQGFLQEARTIIGGSMDGATAHITSGAVFPPGEYELLMFVDVVPGGGVGPQRGDLAAFDNGSCDPTGVSIRFAVGCEDATVTLVNRNFIIF